MARRDAFTEVETVTIHDHLDGSNHCVECGGPCTLTGDDLAVTMLVRTVFVHLAFSGYRTVPPAMKQALESLGVNVETFMERANGTGRVHK